jgi:hypothetical protein
MYAQPSFYSNVKLIELNYFSKLPLPEQAIHRISLPVKELPMAMQYPNVQTVAL